MKKSLLVFSILFVLASLAGCATKGDLEKVQANEQQINMKADQAIKESQDAKAAAVKAAEAAARAEERAKIAEEKARVAEEKAKKSDAIFEKSMKK
ncbi:MAG: hypothetical protein A4E72_01690 [Syntrophus sp. PtaU1.Bin208]|nr:MAG: hypothetical protein A4E72_01690 [Syntrophus sp. PtaU1.Bin208]